MSSSLVGCASSEEPIDDRTPLPRRRTKLHVGVPLLRLQFCRRHLGIRCNKLISVTGDGQQGQQRSTASRLLLGERDVRRWRPP